MTKPHRGAGTANRRAARLVRAYPREWRARYGAELAELLAEDIARRPTSPRRLGNIILNAGVARLRTAGLAGPPPESDAHVRSALAAVFVAISLFLVFGLSMLSQIVVGWRWEPPSGPAITIALVLMATGTATLCALAGAAVLPLLAALVRQITSLEGKTLRAPMLAAFGSAAILVAGARHFEVRWPGSGGHPWAYHAVLPAGPASFAWAATLSVTSYWAHPGALRSFPAVELAWMALSPIALVTAITASVKVVRRVVLCPRLLRYESHIADASLVATSTFLAGAACWVTGRDPAIHGGLYQVGVVDVVELLVMSAAFGLGIRAAFRSRTALRLS